LRALDGLTVCVILALVLGLGAHVVAREGNLAWDDADYLRRGLHNVGKSRIDGWLNPIALIGATLKEKPKPPLLIAWIEAGSVVLGRRNVRTLIVFASVIPFGLLISTVALIARRTLGSLGALTAVLVLAACPMSLAFGAKVMVETFMALWILLALTFAAMLLERPTRTRALMLGTAVACALLTKLTVALLLPGPAVLSAWLYARRYSLDRKAVRMAGWVVLPVVLLAGPWYFRNGLAAIEFAAYSARYDVTALGRADVTPRLVRLRILVERLVGWPILLLAPIAAWGALRSWRKLPSVARDFVALALIGATFGTIGLLVPSYFDPRFLMPICPALAIVLASAFRPESDHIIPRLTAVATVLIAAAGAIHSAAQLRDEPRSTTYWQAQRLIDDLVTEHHVMTIANIGDSRDWNVCKTGLINELRRAPSDCFVLHDLSRNERAEIARRIEKLDAIVVLDRNALPAGFLESSPGLNRAYGTVEPVLAGSHRFEKIEPRIAGLPPLSVYIRRK
jgi:hypothetical protein